MIAELTKAGRKRETIRKSVKYLAAVLEDAGVDPNPARHRRIRLPHEEPTDIEPPTTDHVETVYRLLASAYRLPLLWLDWSGARVASVETILVGDYDEQDQHVRLRARTTKTRTALWVDLPDALAEAIEATCARKDRNSDAPLFPGVSADRLRTAITRACRAAGIPAFSPHDLRHRRISLLHRQGRSWAEIGRFVGQRKLHHRGHLHARAQRRPRGRFRRLARARPLRPKRVANARSRAWRADPVHTSGPKKRYLQGRSNPGGPMSTLGAMWLRMVARRSGAIFVS